ncbi:hypothetical protein ACRAWF_38045 [Streptomyces sp. L7]
MPGALEDRWPGFFHRTHRLLPAGGILLLATRQRRSAGRLTDPLGALIASARIRLPLPPAHRGRLRPPGRRRAWYLPRPRTRPAVSRTAT